MTLPGYHSRPQKMERFCLRIKGGGEGRGEGVEVGWGGYKVYQDSANVNRSTESSLAVTTYSDLYKTFHPCFQISFRYCVCQLDGNRENCDVRLNGRMISESQHFSVCIVERWKKSMGYRFVPACNHVQESRLFLPYLPDHRLLRCRYHGNWT